MNLSDELEGIDFYNVCQAYRHANDNGDAAVAYEHLKQHISEFVTASLSTLLADNVRLREALNAIATGDCRTTSKLENCCHGMYGYEHCENCYAEYAQEALTTPSPPLAELGLVLVPMEPTEAMLQAGIDIPIPMVMMDSISGMAKLKIKTAYKAMLSAYSKESK